MRTRREYYSKKPIVYTFELDTCPKCHGPLNIAYTSGAKTVQTMGSVLIIAHRPRYCPEVRCVRYRAICKSAQWQQIAPRYCTYGYDVIAEIGWLRQMHCQRFEAIHEALQPRFQISESEVRYLYHERYLPLLACHERQHLEQLKAVSEQRGLILGLDGLAPEGGEPQLWLVRELQVELTLRSGWLSGQDQGTFVNFLQPIADLGLRVVAVMSDKQRGLEPAVPIVFPHAKHGLCQMHYLKNAAAPVADEDETLKVTLRKRVRSEVGDLIRREKVEKPGVLTVTGLLPSPVEEPEEPKDKNARTPQAPPDPIAQEHETLVQDLLRRVRYLLTLKGRPPLRLAGVEMFERLTEVEACLDTLIHHRTDARLLELRHGLHTALLSVHSDYTELRQAADWLEHITDLLDPEGKPDRSGREVRQALFAYLDDIQPEGQHSLRLRHFHQKIHQTSLNYAPGLFHCYDIPGLPRTNNDRESEFRDLNRRLLSTTGQKGLVKRIIQRQGAWELIPRPDSLRDTVSALSQVDPDDFSQERQRIRHHRSRFRLHTRSAKRSLAQLKQLEQRWKSLPPFDTS
jgi:rRNA maturation protein Nop10